MKHKLLLIFVLSCLLGFSQTKETALRDAKIASKATLKENYELLLKHTFPPLIKVMGGKEKALKTVKNMMKDFKADGLIFEKVETISVSEIVFEQSQYRCYVQNDNVVKMENGKHIFSKNYLFGIYDSGKKIWYFIEADKLKNKLLTDAILPDFETKLAIPDNIITFED